MHSPALAIAWQLWTRHRSGIVIALVSLVAMLAASPLLPLTARMIASSIVLILVIAYFMNILLFVNSIGSVDSTYPRRMYSLPVSSGTLVGWPMLYGGGVVALLWVAAACLVYRPSGFQTPILLPALWLAATLVWLQAFTWSPISNPLLKNCIPLTFIPLLLAVPVRMLWLWKRGMLDERMRKAVVASSSIDALLTWITEPVVWTLLVTYIALAYFVARRARKRPQGRHLAGLAARDHTDGPCPAPGAIASTIPLSGRGTDLVRMGLQRSCPSRGRCGDSIPDVGGHDPRPK